MEESGRPKISLQSMAKQEPKRMPRDSLVLAPFLSSIMAASKIKSPTAILIPWKAAASSFHVKKSYRNSEAARMTRKGGTKIPQVAARAPAIPACLYPVKVAQLMAMGPGVDSAITVIDKVKYISQI